MTIATSRGVIPVVHDRTMLGLINTIALYRYYVQNTCKIGEIAPCLPVAFVVLHMECGNVDVRASSLAPVLQILRQMSSLFPQSVKNTMYTLTFRNTCWTLICIQMYCNVWKEFRICKIINFTFISCAAEYYFRHWPYITIGLGKGISPNKWQTFFLHINMRNKATHISSCYNACFTRVVLYLPHCVQHGIRTYHGSDLKNIVDQLRNWEFVQTLWLKQRIILSMWW